MNCPIACQNTSLIPNPTAGCKPRKPKKATPSRLLMFLCGLQLPSTFTTANLQPLFTNGDIVATSPLAEVAFGDPTYQEIVTDSCRPPLQYATSRQVTFVDRTPITLVGQSGTPDDEYFHLKFWKDKLDNRDLLYYMVLYCNGDVRIARNDDGTLMGGTLNAQINYQQLDNNGGQLEIIGGTLTFQGDPLQLTPPDFNLEQLGITI